MSEEPGVVEERVCGLPECTETVRQAPGRRTLYCSVNHRIKAQELRRATREGTAESTDSPTGSSRSTDGDLPAGPSDEPLAAAAGETHDPTPTAAAAPSTTPPVRPRPVNGRGRGHLSRTPGPRLPRVSVSTWPARLGTRRQMAGVAAAAVLAAGVVTTWSVMPSGALSPALDGAYQAPPVPWGPQAQVTLSSFDRQLEVTQSALAQWDAVPAALRSPTPPPAVVTLQQRRAFLQSQRDTLAAQLASAQALDQTKTTLDTAMSNLAHVRADQRTATAGPQLSAALSSQEHTLQTQIGMLHNQADALDRDVEAAESSPLPSSDDVTTPLAEQVVGLAEHPPPRTPVGGNPSAQNPAVAGRGPTGSGSSAGASPAATAPPRPGDDGTLDAAAAPGSGLVGGSRDVGSRGPAAPQPRPGVGGAVGAVGGAVEDTAGSLLGSNSTGAELERAAGGSGQRSETGPTRSGVAGAVDAIGDAAGLLLGSSDSSSRASAPEQDTTGGAARSRNEKDGPGGALGSAGSRVGSLLNPRVDQGSLSGPGPGRGAPDVGDSVLNLAPGVPSLVDAADSVISPAGSEVTGGGQGQQAGSGRAAQAADRTQSSSQSSGSPERGEADDGHLAQDSGGRSSSPRQTAGSTAIHAAGGQAGDAVTTSARPRGMSSSSAKRLGAAVGGLVAQMAPSRSAASSSAASPLDTNHDHKTTTESSDESSSSAGSGAGASSSSEARKASRAASVWKALVGAAAQESGPRSSQNSAKSGDAGSSREPTSSRSSSSSHDSSSSGSVSSRIEARVQSRSRAAGLFEGSSSHSSSSDSKTASSHDSGPKTGSSHESDTKTASSSGAASKTSSSHDTDSRSSSSHDSGSKSTTSSHDSGSKTSSSHDSGSKSDSSHDSGSSGGSHGSSSG